MSASLACPYCGMDLRPGQPICTRCGRRLVGEPVATTGVRGHQETMVRVYRGTAAYRREAQRLAQEGWVVANTVEHRPRSGCLRVFLLLGIFALVFPPKPELTVTYVRVR